MMPARYISPQCGLNGVPRWRQNSEFPVCLTQNIRKLPVHREISRFWLTSKQI